MVVPLKSQKTPNASNPRNPSNPNDSASGSCASILTTDAPTNEGSYLQALGGLGLLEQGLAWGASRMTWGQHVEFRAQASSRDCCVLNIVCSFREDPRGSAAVAVSRIITASRLNTS